MKRWQGSLGRESVDTAPTAADFPRRMWDKKDIGPDYRKYLNMWLRAGVDLGCVILVPAARYQPDIREYMLSYFGDEIMVLERGEDGAVTKTVIKRKDIFCFCSTEDLLRGCISIYWGTRYEIHRTALPYNRVRRELFLPVVNWLADCPADFYSPKAPGADAVPRRLKEEQPSLYHYGKDVYRFGNRGRRWEWWGLGAPGAFGKKRQMRSACLSCELEKGQVFILQTGSQVDIWYLKRGDAQASVEEQGREKKIVVTVKSEPVMTRSFRAR